MGGSKKQTVGYWYKWLLHFGWCRGPVDAVLELRGGGATMWSGRLTQSGRIHINKPELWGGEDSQGGVQGDWDILFGEPTQQPNDYLTANLGATPSETPGGDASFKDLIDLLFSRHGLPGEGTPDATLRGQSAHRAKLTTVARGGRFGANIPNPKPVSIKVERILSDWKDDVVWYPEKARIGLLAGVPLALYFAIDHSDSMTTVTANGSTRLENMRTAINGVLDDIVSNVLPNGTVVDIQIVAWNANASAPSILRRNVDESDVADIKAWLATQGTAVGTYFPAGLQQMAGFFSGSPPSSNRIALFITDGEPFTDGLTAQQIAEAAAALVTPDVKLYGINIDEPDTTYTGMVDNTPADGVPVVEGGDPAALQAIIDSALSSLVGMNPAHMLYDSIVYEELQGEPASMISDASFRAAADRLYSEGLGLCTTWDSSSETPEQFQQRLCNLIGGCLNQSRVDGLYYLDLIRAPDDLNALPVITEDDVIAFKQTPGVIAEAPNLVRVEWFDPTTKEVRTTAPIYAAGAIQAAGAVIPDSRKYHEVPIESLALRLGKRDLDAGGTPGATFDLTVLPRFRGLRPGTNARLQLPSEGIADLVITIIKVDQGTVRDSKMQLSAIQNIFSMPDAVYVQPDPPVWTPPAAGPKASPAQIAFEAPYVELVSAMSAADLQALAADAGFLAAAAVRPVSGVSFELDTAADGADYAAAGSGDWCGTAVIGAAAGPVDTTFDFTFGQDLDRVDLGSWASWDGEIVRVDALDTGAGSLTLGRGCADTVPIPHAAGSRIYFCGDWLAADPREYVGGETVHAKLLTRTTSGKLDLATATALSVVMSERANRPYPPAQVLINGSAYPEVVSGDVSLSWVPRDRLGQADQLVDTTQPGVGPEAGTTYNVRVFGEADTLLREVTGIAGTAYGYTNDDEVVDNGGATGDPDWASVVSVLNMAGASGSTAFPDGAGLLWTPAGNVQIDSSLGYNAAKFDGAGDYLSTPAATAFDFGSGDFTIEIWGLVNALGTQHTIFENRSSDSSSGLAFYVGAASHQLSVFSAGATRGLSAGQVPAGVLFHGAYCVRQGIATVYLNGQGGAPVSLPAGFTFPCPAAVRVGSQWNGSNYLNGFVKALRVTKGLARYNGNFSAPAAPFPIGLPTARLNGRLRFELASERDGVTSYQMHSIEVRRAGYGFNYGMYYGGE